MLTVARLGALAVLGVASAAVAIPHLLATGHAAAPMPHVAVPVVPVAIDAGPTRELHVPPPQVRRRRHQSALEIDHLPRLAPYSLPPRLMLRARAHAPAARRALERRVLHSPHLALSPGAKRAVGHHRVAPGALALLLHTPHLGSPLLVFSARGRSLEVQATRMWMTRSTLVALGRLPARGRPASLRLRPVNSAFTDVHASHGGMLGPQAVAIAKRYLGIPYVWGGSTPTGGFDCSGLRHVRLPAARHHARPLRGLAVPRGQAHLRRPTCSRATSSSSSRKSDGPGHVGIYVGDGKMINAPHTGDVVRIASIQGRSGYVGAVRPY